MLDYAMFGMIDCMKNGLESAMNNRMGRAPLAVLVSPELHKALGEAGRAFRGPEAGGACVVLGVKILMDPMLNGFSFTYVFDMAEPGATKQ